MASKVEIRDNRELRRVEALDEDGQVAGFAAYQISVEGDTFDFQHTEVDERFEGEGIGSELAAGVMEFAREEGVKILPSCSFIRHYMSEHEDTHDLLAGEASLAEDDGAGSGDGEDDSDAPDLDSPDAGPADAKAAGSGGAADEESSRS